MRVLGAGGVGLEVWVDGPEDGEPVLFLHGWPDDHTLWRHQVAALSDDGYRTIAPDLRGFGASDKPEGVQPYRLKHTVADAIAILDAAGVEQANVVAHDWGAAAAWGLAAFVPDRVNRFATLSVGHPRAFRDAGMRQRMLSWYMLLFQFEGVAEQWFAENGREMLLSHPDRDERLVALGHSGALTASLGWYRANSHPRNLVGDPPKLPAVRCPVMGIWSSRDLALTEQQMTGSAAWVDGPWRYERIDNAGHWMQLDAPGHVTDLLRDFLKS